MMKRRPGKLQHIAVLMHVGEMMSAGIHAGNIFRVMMIEKLMQQIFRSEKKRNRCQENQRNMYAENFHLAVKDTNSSGGVNDVSLRNKKYIRTTVAPRAENKNTNMAPAFSQSNPAMVLAANAAMLVRPE